MIRSGLVSIVMITLWLMGASVAAEAPAEPRPEPPVVALLDFSAEGPSYVRDRTAAEISAAVQAVLSGHTETRWVERERLAAARRELELAALTADDHLRIGQWLGADLLVRGQFSEVDGGRQLRLEVIEAARADVLASRELVVASDLGPLPKVDDRDLTVTADAVRDLLQEAQERLAGSEGATCVAALFVRNLSPTDRLDGLEQDLLDGLEAEARMMPDLRLLRFAGAAPARREAELSLLGLTDEDPQAWRSVAHCYLWGSFQEQVPEGTSKVPVDQLEVEITLQLWDGQHLTTAGERAPVRELAAAQRRLIRRILALAQRHDTAAADAGSRDEVVDRLLQRAKALAPDVRWEQMNAWQRRLHAHHLRLIEVACFLAPDSRRARWSLVEALSKRTYPTGPDALAVVLRQLRTMDRYCELFDAEPPPGHRHWPVWRYAVAMGNAARLLGDPEHRDVSSDLPLAIRQRWLSGVAARAAEMGEAMQKAGTSLAPDSDLRRMIATALAVPISPGEKVRLIEAWWPLYQPHYQHEAATGRVSLGPRRYLEDELLAAYAAAGRPEAGRALLVLEPAPHVAEAAASPPTPRKPITLERAQELRAEQLARRARLIAEGRLSHDPHMQSLLHRPHVPAAPRPAPGPETPRWRPPMRFVELERLRMARPLIHQAPPHEVTDLAFFANRLWISARRGQGGEAMARLLALDPATGRFEDVGAAVGGLPVNPPRLQAEARGLWITIAGEGLRRIGPDGQVLERVTPEDGLISRDVAALGLTGDQLLAAPARGQRLSVLRVNAGVAGVVSDLSLPAPLQQALGTRPSLATAAGWVLLPRPEPALFDLAMGRSRDLADVLRGDQAAAPPLRAWAAAEDAFWLATDDTLIRHAPGEGHSVRWPLNLPGPCEFLWVDGEFVWLGYTRQQHVPPVDMSDGRGTQPVTSLLLWHRPSERCVSWFPLPGRVTVALDSPRRLWVALTEGEATLVEIDKLACYRQARGGAEPAAGDDEFNATPQPPQNAGADEAWSPLMAAARSGQVDLVRRLLDESTDVNQRSGQHDDAVTPLEVAAEMGYAEVVQLLLKRGAQPNRVGLEAADLLLRMVRAGHLETVRLLLEHGYAPDPPATYATQDHLPCTPLMLAVAQQDREMMEVLLDHGARADQPFGPGRRNTALHIAVATGEASLVEALVARGADLNVRGDFGRSPLYEAARLGEWGLVDHLLHLGANPDTPTSSGATALFIACSQGRPETIRRLVEAGARLNVVEEQVPFSSKDPRRDMITPFIAAAKSRHPEILRLLIDLGVDPQRELVPGHREGDLALFHAASAGRWEAVAILQAEGFDVTAPDPHGHTALHRAVERRAGLATVQRLLAMGLDPAAATPRGARAIDLTTDQDIRAALLKASPAGAAPDPQRQRPSPGLAQHLLVEAAERGDSEELRRLLELGTDPNTTDQSRDGWPALLLAARHGHLAAVDRLLAFRANVDATGPADWTALMQAAARGHLGVVQRLLEAGAKPHLQNSLGQTARDLARQRGHEEIRQILEMAEERGE